MSIAAKKASKNSQFNERNIKVEKKSGGSIQDIFAH